MKLSELLRKECLVTNLKSTEKNDIIKELLSYCNLSMEDSSQDDIYNSLLEREEELTTGIGDGLAFPHARITGLTKVHIVVGVSKAGVEFNSLDKKPVHFIALILVNHAKPNELLKTRAAIAKLLMQSNNREKFFEAQQSDELWRIIDESGIEVDYEITAKDIMHPFIAAISPDSSINEATAMLHRHHIDSLPVIDEDKKFCGEISCYDLFSYGLPEFFHSLHVISFVKHMNPFEKYFDVDKTSQVSHILEKKDNFNLVISADATLMEIIFEMTVNNKEFLYVLSDDGRLRGILDRYSIIDKILIAR